MLSPRIRKYKKAIECLNVDELIEILKKARLTNEERTAVELSDVYMKPHKHCAELMSLEERQFNKYLNRARTKIYKQILKK